MSVKVLFFGATADIVGQRAIETEVSAGDTAASVFDRLAAAYPGLNGRKLHIAVNQKYAVDGETVNDGDQMAIFAPVSGG